ncbi:MAG: hypothetical protein ABIY50_11110 [Ignavibacteria bacterium]
MTDNEIKIKGYNILLKEMGQNDAEKFISLIISKPGDYTLWREDLFKNKSVKEISLDAMKYRADKRDL